jgi:hypothetical protein
MQKSSTSCLFSAKSTQDQTQALSLPACSCSLAVGMTARRGAGVGGGADVSKVAPQGVLGRQELHR